MGARSRSIAMASMPHSMPLPGPSRPHVKTVNCPVRNVGSATAVSRTGAPCAMMETFAMSTAYPAASRSRAVIVIATTASAFAITDSRI
jgi:hypothetical protein